MNQIENKEMKNTSLGIKYSIQGLNSTLDKDEQMSKSENQFNKRKLYQIQDLKKKEMKINMMSKQMQD